MPKLRRLPRPPVRPHIDIHLVCHIQAFRYVAIVTGKSRADFLAVVVEEETDACSAAMQLGRVAGAPNDIDSVMGSVDRKAVAGKFSVDEVFFVESILWLTVTIPRVSVS